MTEPARADQRRLRRVRSELERAVECGALAGITAAAAEQATQTNFSPGAEIFPAVGSAHRAIAGDVPVSREARLVRRVLSAWRRSHVHAIAGRVR